MSDSEVTISFSAATGDAIDGIKDVMEALKELTDLTGELSKSLQGQDAAAMGALHAQLAAAGTASKDALAELLLEFKDVLGGGAQIVADLATSFTQAMKSGGAFKAALDAVADGLKGDLAEIAALIASVKELSSAMALGGQAAAALWPHLGVVISDVFTDLEAGVKTVCSSLVAATMAATTSVGQAFANVGSVIRDALGGNLGAASADFQRLKSEAAGAGAAIEAALKGSGSGFDFANADQELSKFGDAMKGPEAEFVAATNQDQQTLTGELGAISGRGPKPNAAAAPAQAQGAAQQAQAVEAQKAAAAQAGAQSIEGVNQQLNAQLASGGQAAADQSVALEEKAVAGQIKALQEGLRQRQTVLAAEVAQHKISQDQKFAALEAETQKEYEAERALLQKELALGELKVSQRQAIENKIVALDQKSNLEMIRLDEQSIAAAQRAWDGYFNTLEGAFNSQLRGLLAGTTSWSTAFKNILGDLIIKFIETVEKMALQWAAGEIAQTAATTSGAAARAAAQTGALAASSAGTAASVLHSIAASASEAFAGIFGFLSPVMGPAAAGPAAAGQATVLAAASGVSAFAQGSWELPSDMIAQVHKGEMIVPAAQTPWAQSLMANAGGGQGGDVHVHHATHFNVTALDSRDVKRWIAGNGKTILDTINESVRRGAHLGLNKLAAR